MAELTDPQRQTVFQLLTRQRWAALATASAEGPYGSMVTFVAAPRLDQFVMLLSRLAKHTQLLLRDPRACMIVSEADCNGGDPQRLVRASIEGVVAEVTRDQAAEFERLSRLFIDRHPQASQLLALGDFSFYCLRPQRVRIVAGFGEVYMLTAEALGTCCPGDAE